MGVQQNMIAAAAACASAAGSRVRSRRHGKHSMTRIVLFVLSCLAGPVPLLAVPANPEPWKTSQPDGAQIRLCLKGDERFHWHEDASGYPVLKDAGTGQWVYATEGVGGLAATAYVVGKTDPAAVGLAKSRMDRVRASIPARSQALASDGDSQAVAATGTLKNLVVLVNFSDKTITQTTQEFDNLFNQIGYTTGGAAGSVKDYYLEVSLQRLDCAVGHWRPGYCFPWVCLLWRE